MLEILHQRIKLLQLWKCTVFIRCTWRISNRGLSTTTQKKFDNSSKFISNGQLPSTTSYGTKQNAKTWHVCVCVCVKGHTASNYIWLFLDKKIKVMTLHHWSSIVKLANFFYSIPKFSFALSFWHQPLEMLLKYTRKSKFIFLAWIAIHFTRIKK